MRKYATLIVLSWAAKTTLPIPTTGTERKTIRLWFWTSFDVSHETIMYYAKEAGAPKEAQYESYSKFPIGSIKLQDILEGDPIILNGNIAKA